MPDDTFLWIFVHLVFPHVPCFLHLQTLVLLLILHFAGRLHHLVVAHRFCW